MTDKKPNIIEDILFSEAERKNNPYIYSTWSAVGVIVMREFPMPFSILGALWFLWGIFGIIKYYYKKGFSDKKGFKHDR